MSSRSLSEEEFVLLVSRLERRVRSFARVLMVDDQENVDELVQSTTVAAWRRLSTFSYDSESPEDDLARWMFAIARLELRSLRRARARDRHVLSEDLLDQLANDYADREEVVNERHDALRLCLEKLSGIDRDVLAAKYASGLPVKKISELIGRTEMAIYNNLSRLRKKLRRCVERRITREGSV